VDEIFKIPESRNIHLKGTTSDACVEKNGGNICLRSFYLPEYSISATEITLRPNFRIDVIFFKSNNFTL
jgi:hypothetical protein